MVDVIIPGLRLRERAEDEWQEAAFHWRLPFWDWAKNPQIPKLMCFKRIQLRFPAMTVDNPFYKFKMPKGEKMRVYGVGTLKSPDFEDTLEVRVSMGVTIFMSRSTNIAVHSSSTGSVAQPAAVRRHQNV